MEWFESWFESPYYHVLYKNRDYNEAQHFLDNLLQFLNLDRGSHILDLACGKGRHSVYLNKLGYQVTGADLSSYNVQQASLNANETLRFIKHDMREVIAENTFDAVFNVFTSFGYFKDDSDNQKVLHAVSKELKPEGVFVLDFLNIHQTIDRLNPSEVKEIDGLTFKITKEIRSGFIFKNIQVFDGDKSFGFQERVQALSEKQLKLLIESSGLEVIHCFGDYELSKYDSSLSPRIILIAKKDE